eukprot:CAMPEP_0115837888 /NCGR_PEP_ID=MMETSP0287-20121206/5449_1 /TAXON_ID=412157 /ORGANISM="Chrysochromulina rotalis, Strain UIO044" /LENGTH=253 /DNA_ID=CAMNT_0003291405 /DNA_START=96 /DNA_END=853 /DNA_ORIENTATION=-
MTSLNGGSLRLAIDDVDLWFLTAHSFSHRSRVLFHRPELCATGRATLSLAELKSMAQTTLDALRPNWWHPEDRAGFEIAWRPCESPLSVECGGEPAETIIDSPLAAFAILARLREHRHGSTNMTRLKLVLRPASTPLAFKSASVHPESQSEVRSTGVAIAKSWEALRSCMAASCAYRCPLTASYADYLANLPTLHPNDLRLPAHVSILAYGTSFLGQVVEAIVCSGTITHFASFEVPTDTAIQRQTVPPRSPS